MTTQFITTTHLNTIKVQRGLGKNPKTFVHMLTFEIRDGQEIRKAYLVDKDLEDSALTELYHPTCQKQGTITIEVREIEKFDDQPKSNRLHGVVVQYYR